MSCFQRLTGHKKLFNVVFDNVVAHNLGLLFEGRRFQSRTFAKIERDYLANGDKYSKHLLCQHRKSLIGYRSVCLHLTFAHYKGHGQINHISTANIS